MNAGMWESLQPLLTTDSTSVIHTEEKPYEYKEHGRTLSHDSATIQHQRMHDIETQVNLINVEKPSIKHLPLINHQRIYVSKQS